jgi:predicted phosphodiesterase
MTCLVISDWHRFNDLAYDAIGYAGEYDAVILLGDSSPGVDFEEQVVNNIVNFSGEISKGEKPTIYVRGNHETRGEYAGNILDALGMFEFYYTADLGKVTFLVLDSGEDKVNTHPEYGGMTDYYSYRKNMIDWLKTVEIEDEKVIALCHSWAISDIEKDLSLEGWKELDRLGTDLMLSGHTHECRFIGDGDETEKEIMSLYPDIAGYMDGGYIDGGRKADKYIASKITLGEDDILIEAFDNTGEKVFNETVKW